ncbi:MAG: hypothetical protein EAX95_06845 [Candidatus Thorarchaeota archaeon]|nr:hypothetical protein [Candidatus Thorarchaeota archaeon]
MDLEDCDAKRIGSYYTPSWLAKWISENTLAAWLSEKHRTRSSLLSRITSIKIVDPASGDGAFLMAAGEWLLSTRKGLGDLGSDDEIRRHIVDTSLYGVDIVRQAADDCRNNLLNWAEGNVRTKVEHGNSISGQFKWSAVFRDVFQRENSGFDVVLGNPPYGNLLSDEEKMEVRQSLIHDISTGRRGTWNTAALFMVRARELLREDGYLGFLVPNSILRVGQFSKLREFLLDQFTVTTIVDEGSPFEGVTLEVISILAKAKSNSRADSFSSISRRPGIEGTRKVPLDVCQSSRVIPLYYDDIFKKAIERGNRDALSASRGRDIQKIHVSKYPSIQFDIPYATSGRSVKRYRLDEGFLIYADNWFRDDSALVESYENELLLATKNYPYPRCVMKPKGIIHGGGAVTITSTDKDLDMKAVGMVLNSRFVRYLCIRYLTNYSQLTTCLNTGIMEDLPLAVPSDTSAYATVFDMLSSMHSSHCQDVVSRDLAYLESIADALVYELYLSDTERLLDIVDDALKDARKKSVLEALRHPDISDRIARIFSNSRIRRIESSPRM